MAKKRQRYTDEERASYVVMLQAAGYPDKKGAMQEVVSYSGINERVLRRWFKGTQNPPPDKLVRHKKIDLKKAIDTELASIFSEMNTKREDADYRALGTVAGILMDKKFLLEGKPTERIAIDMDSVKAELRRKIEAGEMTREQALQVTDNDTDLVNEFFKGAASRVSVGKE